MWHIKLEKWLGFRENIGGTHPCRVPIFSTSISFILLLSVKLKRGALCEIRDYFNVGSEPQTVQINIKNSLSLINRTVFLSHSFMQCRRRSSKTNSSIVIGVINSRYLVYSYYYVQQQVNHISQNKYDKIFLNLG